MQHLFFFSGLLRACQIPAEVSRQGAQEPGRRSAHVRDAGRQRDSAGAGGQNAGDQIKPAGTQPGNERGREGWVNLKEN